MVILGFLLLVILVYFIERGSGVSNPASKSTPTNTPSPIKSIKPLSSKPTVPARFDQASARHLPNRRVITGAVYVTDGDTIKIKNTQIRLYGIDAPELDHPYGSAAKWALHKLCKGQQVRAEITAEDRYGRTVARCFLSDGRDLSAEMGKLGLALDWPKYSGGEYSLLEAGDLRKKHWKAAARQRGHMHIFHK